MKVEGNKVILEHGDKFTGCGYTIEVRDKEEVVPTPTPPSDEQETDEQQMFLEMLYKFNQVLFDTGHKVVSEGMDIFGHLNWVYGVATKEWETNEQGYFTPNNYPDVFNFYGKDDSTLDVAYNAMQAWLMAMYLARICPTYGEHTNTQTELYKLAYELGGGKKFPLFGGKTFKANPYIARIIAGKLFAYTAGNEVDEARWNIWRDELGGQMIPASCWDELGYEYTELRDENGWRIGFRTDKIGWTVNTSLFLPSAPAPRVPDTIVNEQPYPWQEGQAEAQFNNKTGNYVMDELAYDYVVNNYNMMAQTPLAVWESYSNEKKNRLINVMATPPCTCQYMFSEPKCVQLVLDEDGKLPIVDGYPRFVFEQCALSPLVIYGAFGDLSGIIRYNCDGQETPRELTLKRGLEVADNLRLPTQDPNYGRCRPGCAPTKEGGERNPIHGAAENELFNVSIACMVADSDAEKEKWANEDGFAADSPKSYVSGHSAQIVAMALLLGEMCPDKLNEWVHNAFKYSANRYIGRYHWLSDVIYGRIFGTIAVSTIGAMEGMQDGLRSIKEWIDNPTPQPEPIPTDDCHINIVMHNHSGRTATLNGELCLVLANPDINGVYYGWDGCYNRTGHITYMDGGVVLQDGDECRIDNVSMANGEVTVRGRNLLSSDLLPIAGKPSNVLLYDIDGNSENFVPTPVDSNIIFEDGVTIEIVF